MERCTCVHPCNFRFVRVENNMQVWLHITCGKHVIVPYVRRETLVNAR